MYDAENSLAPFVPTPPEVVRKMLELARVGPEDVVYDLGCGDGRVLFTAVNEFGVKKAVGYELREDLYHKVVQEIERWSLQGRIRVFNEDLFEADLSEATVITLYLTTYGNDRLEPKLRREARYGTRIISHDFSIQTWQAMKRENFDGHTVYYYVTPHSLPYVAGRGAV